MGDNGMRVGYQPIVNYRLHHPETQPALEAASDIRGTGFGTRPESPPYFRIVGAFGNPVAVLSEA
jgi:hypothetical protein